MSIRRAPGLARQRALRLVTHLLGSVSWLGILASIAVLVTLGWLGDSLLELIGDLGAYLEGDPVEAWWPLQRIVGLAVFPLLVGVLWIFARRAREGYRVSVATDDSPAQARGLILYLSALQDGQEEQIRAAGPFADGIDSFRTACGKLPWRMPLEAIAYHLPRLGCVHLVSSIGPRGSRRQVGLFRELVAALFDAPGVELRDLAELDSRYGPGVDFDDVDALARATDDAYQALRDKGLQSADILIDVTGGQKTNSIAGAAVALAEGRHIQYVCRADYRVILFDVSYES